MGENEPLYWLTGIGDSKLHNAAAFHGDKIGVLPESWRKELAQSLGNGTASPGKDTKIRWIPLGDIASVARSPNGCNLRITEVSGRRTRLAATPDDSAKIVRIYDELKARIAPDAQVEETQATFSEAIGPPSAVLFLFAIFSAAIYFLTLGEDAGPGRKGVAKLLYAIGYNNVLWGMVILASLVVLWGLIRVTVRPKMEIFHVRKSD